MKKINENEINIRLNLKISYKIISKKNNSRQFPFNLEQI